MKDKVLTFLQQEIDKHVTPGAVIRIKHKGKVILEEAIGSNSLEDDRVTMTNRHVFDMASITKVMVTLPVMLQLLESGDIHLNDKVTKFLPGFAKNGKESITLRQLLTHSSGLIAHRPYFERKLTTPEVLADILQEQLSYVTDTQVVYSDLGYILLMEVIEKVTGQPLEEFSKQHLFHPLAMMNTGYVPKYKRTQFAPTEFLEHLKGHKYGIVHDDNTEFMGGISGHAGLFSTMEDVSNFTDMLENYGVYEGKQILHPEWLRKSRDNFTPFSDESRGLGWQLKGHGISPAGDLLSPTTYGHTGYTGTSFYIDPRRELTVTLLTNRVYFGRHDPIIRLRPRLHNIIVTNLTN
ncbi:beta-lactamase family protein [Psychrobacillus sp. INOP01]|uniref:serine hydrolase domain-containing protein n=1 Tax=Psychrobacillus sp. INOP01 TaxID=2829187 RepID=UPI001BA869DF|nr:serine hydrolase domain-containing protein [Psychrobacillus sp. INOP01]QUG43096.1 beta-lactamase family protein [Psychrobacillus sp. INOP01]